MFVPFSGMFVAVQTHMRDKDSRTENSSPLNITRHSTTMLSTGFKNTRVKSVLFLGITKLYIIISKNINEGLVAILDHLPLQPYYLIGFQVF